MNHVVRARKARGKGLRSRAAKRRKFDLAVPRTAPYDLPTDPGRAGRPQRPTTTHEDS